MREIWKDIEGFESLYKISNLGRFKSFKYKEEKILKKGDAMGYEIIRLFKNQKIYTLKVHRLVASHFIENQETKPEVNHKNGNKKDNTVFNVLIGYFFKTINYFFKISVAKLFSIFNSWS